jgi:hypothetical protein
MSLPAIETCKTSETALSEALSLLLEPSPALRDFLIPYLASPQATYESYDDLLDLSEGAVMAWPADRRRSFIAAHPRIGEVSNLSDVSAREQASRATPPEVLDQLAVRALQFLDAQLEEEQKLNAEYERIFPGLVYITFVNGRLSCRARIALKGQQAALEPR